MASNEVSIATYMPAVTFAKALDVIKLVSEGETVLAACETIYIAVQQFRAACKREPALQTMLAEAEETRDDILADMLVDEAKLPSEPKMAAIISANIKFLIERRRPMKYGKVPEAINPDSDQNRLLAEALRAAIDRIPTPPQVLPAITDASFTVVERKEEAPVLRPAPVLGETSQTPVEAANGLEELRRLGLI